ncbi:mucin-2 [Battus philenor]|uniref:mucin-2 n=1 Tax=Battus philenor TaxID=42288 RepID=UPI0035D09FB0
MVRGAVLVLVVALAWVCRSQASVLIPTYVLPPDSFVRDQRSLASPPDSDTAETQRTVKRLVGGHMKIKHNKEYSASKNYIGYDGKTESGKFAGVYVPEQSGGTVGWNQGIWDDGMLMSSAGEGKETGKVKEDDEEKKTLSDQVAEGKYGLIQNEIFARAPKRPGIVSYEPNSETRSKDNLQSLGGLKKDEIWLAEDHLLVLKGGSFPERTKESERKPWPPIDSYEAPRRQVKLPQKPKVPPPFPVRLSDNGPLVFLTPNGSVPASLFPPFPTGEGDGPLPPPPFLFTAGAPYSPSDDQRNSSSGEAPMRIPTFPFLPGNASEGPYPPSMNGSFPEGFPPGAAFLPPPSNQTDLYDEDDPSIYYPPPYNFSYHSEYNNSVPAGPLVPGIILPPPPDFFAPLEEKTTTETIQTTRPEKTSTYPRPKSTRKQTTPPTTYRRKYKTRPTSTESTMTTEVPTTVTNPPATEIVTTPKERTPQRVVPLPPRHPIRVHNLPDEITTRPKNEKPVYKSRTKLTSKPLSVSVIYDYPEQAYNTKPPVTSENPYVIYRIPEKTPNSIHDEIITSTQVPLRAYYSDTQNDGIPATKLQPVYRRKPSQNAVASFYFYDEQPKSSPTPETYFDGRNYYKTVPANAAPLPEQPRINSQQGYNPAVDVSYGAIDDSDGLYLWPPKQSPKTLTQEYFSIQNPRPQPVYVQHTKQNPNTFYQQIADISQTIDLFTTKRPKAQSQRYTKKQKHATPRPVYQFSYQSNPRPEQLTFRAPKLDPEPFRPMVSYSKPFNVENEFNAISSPSVSPVYNQQYLVENVQVTTETPTPSRYYPKTKHRNEDYDDPSVSKEANKNRNHIPVQSSKPASPVHHVNPYPSTTPNPISNGYYTKQDERYFDDITRNSFDIFGQKVEDGAHDINGLAVTPPLETVRTPVNNNINLQYDYELVPVSGPTNPPSLEKDTLVNYRLPRPQINPNSEPIPASPNAQLVRPTNPPSLLHDTRVNDRYPRPTINPNSEFIPIPNPNYRKAAQYGIELDDLNAPPPSLHHDTDVNYKNPAPTINPDAEWIPPVNTGDGRRGAFVSYRLPGEGAHVYFLTPQASQGPPERHRSPGYGR